MNGGINHEKASSLRILIVGGDQPATFVRMLSETGAELVGHWRGLQTYEARKILPAGVDIVFIIWDRVSHPLANSVRAQANARGLPLYFCRTSGHIRRKLLELAPKDGERRVAC